MKFDITPEDVIRGGRQRPSRRQVKRAVVCLSPVALAVVARAGERGTNRAWWARVALDTLTAALGAQTAFLWASWPPEHGPGCGCDDGSLSLRDARVKAVGCKCGWTQEVDTPEQATAAVQHHIEYDNCSAMRDGEN